jgi:hypothetical protein
VSEPVEGFDQVEGGLVVDGEFVEAGRDTSPLLASAEAPLDLVAVFVRLGVEAGRPAAARSAAAPVGDLVGRLGDVRADTTSP